MGGNPESELRQIAVNDTQIQVCENLWWALYHLREDTQPRILWIDTLRINQDDTSERNHQVGQMDKIYSRATKVVAWVGRGHILDGNLFYNDGAVAIAFVQELKRRSVSDFPYRESNPSPRRLGRTTNIVKWDA